MSDSIGNSAHDFRARKRVDQHVLKAADQIRVTAGLGDVRMTRTVK